MLETPCVNLVSWGLQRTIIKRSVTEGGSRKKPLLNGERVRHKPQLGLKRGDDVLEQRDEGHGWYHQDYFGRSVMKFSL